MEFECVTTPGDTPGRFIHYCRSGCLDSLLDKMSDFRLERGMELTLNEMESNRKSEEEIAVELVKEWLSLQSFAYRSGSTVTIVAAIDESGVSEQYIDTKYWAQCFAEHRCYKETYWSDLFKGKEPNYRKVTMSELIPDDPIHRMVLHYLRRWGSRLNRYILDEEIPQEERKSVLKKQIENFAFLSRNNYFGCHWKVYSEPNDLLQQALDNDGIPITALDKKGDTLRFIMGQPITVSADKDIPKTAAAGPTPDDKDKKIYNFIQKYAVSKLGKEKVHSSWTMVKSSFKYKGTPTRCYAFSGQSRKELHNMPLKWWEERSGPDAWDDGEEVRFGNGSTLQSGNKLVLALFNALRSSIEEDFKKMTLLVAFDKRCESRLLIEYRRRDIRTLDYGEFYDYVTIVVMSYDARIKMAMTNIMRGELPDVDIQPYVPCVLVCFQNQQFVPNKEEIKQLLSKSCSDPEKVDRIYERLCGMSEKLLRELEEKLKQLPKKFLDLVEKRLKTFKCGEDNVIDVTLHELLQFCGAFLNIQVTFVSMDKENENGKPFCGDCAVKVNFYSVLPILLRTIGFTGKDFDQLTHIL